MSLRIRPIARRNAQGRSASLSWLLLAGLALILGGCQSTGGGGSETETISGRTRDVAGNALHNARVTLWPDSLLLDPVQDGTPEPIASTSTDARGHFKLDSLPAGKFRLHIVGAGGSLYALRDVELDGKPGVLSFDSLKLEPGGSLQGRFDTASSERFDRYVQVYGIPRVSRCESNGRWKIDGLPVGKYRLRYLTDEPFRLAVNSESLLVSSKDSTGAAIGFSRRGLKLNLLSGSGGLHFEGIGPENPLLYDNEFCGNTAEMPFFLPAVSRGGLNLKGWIVTKDFSSPTPHTLESQLKECREAKEIGRLAGFDIPVSPVTGSPDKLTPAASGRLVDMKPYPSAGASLILAEAAKASPEKPLVIIVGGTLSTVASAYLLDPTIVDRIAVIGIYNDGINGKDSLANFLVAQKFKFIHWGRGYYHPRDSALSLLDSLPTHALGLFAHAQLLSNTAGLGDLPLSFLLLKPTLFQGATAFNLRAPPLKVQSVPEGESGDFWDIGQSHNDFPGMVQYFYDSLYRWKRPVQQIGDIEGASFARSKGVQVKKDSSSLEFYAQLTENDSVSWSLSSPQAKTAKVTLWVRTQKAINMTVGIDQAKTSTVSLPANAEWQTIDLDLELPGGVFELHLKAGAGTLDVRQLGFH